MDRTEQILEKFEQISAIPRRSGEEARVKAWLKEWADVHSFSWDEDEVGNICIKVPGEGQDALVIQGHLDMVCEKVPESNHDFSNDGLKLVRQGDWLSAEGTTLGADNGIAVAMAMVLAEANDVIKPPLELLFTVDEETGLTGASGLDPKLVTGKTLLNIDSEEEGVFTIGCAGGSNGHIEFPLKRVNNRSKDAEFFEIKISGARGGHSGIDIHKQRANAIRVLSRVLLNLRNKHELFIDTISGGSAHNAVPRDAKAVVAVERCKSDSLENDIKNMNDLFHSEFKSTDPNLNVQLNPTSGKTYFTQGATEKLLNLIHALPHGVEAMSTELEGVVDSSVNLATIDTRGDSVHVLSSQRSCNVSRLESLDQRFKAVGHLAGAKVRISDSYPPWQPDWQSALLERSKKTYESLFQKAPVVEVIHAGLECGIIGEKCQGMQMISFGPNIEDAHSPDERLQISDVPKVWKLLVALVEGS